MQALAIQIIYISLEKCIKNYNSNFNSSVYVDNVTKSVMKSTLLQLEAFPYQVCPSVSLWGGGGVP